MRTLLCVRNCVANSVFSFLTHLTVAKQKMAKEQIDIAVDRMLCCAMPCQSICIHQMTRWYASSSENRAEEFCLTFSKPHTHTHKRCIRPFETQIKTIRKTIENCKQKKRRSKKWQEKVAKWRQYDNTPSTTQCTLTDKCLSAQCRSCRAFV